MTSVLCVYLFSAWVQEESMTSACQDLFILVSSERFSHSLSVRRSVKVCEYFANRKKFLKSDLV